MTNSLSVSDVTLKSAPVRPAWRFCGVGLIEWGILAIGLLFVSSLTKFSNYLLFHSVAELISICIAVTVTLITISCWSDIRNEYLRIIGLSYIFIAVLDLLHTLSYTGMNIFVDYNYYAPQFWIASRYMESVSILIGFGATIFNIKPNMRTATISYFVITVALTLSIIKYKIFPVCFVAGQGLTTFKIISEYVIVCILLIDIYALFVARRKFGDTIRKQILLSLVFMILMELCFTLYSSDAMSDAFNEIGHLLKICAFYMVYKSIVVTGLHDPVSFLFRDLKASEQNLIEAQRMARLGQWEWDTDISLDRWLTEIPKVQGSDKDRIPSLPEVFLALDNGEQQTVRSLLGNAAKIGIPFSYTCHPAAVGLDTWDAELKCKVVKDDAGRVLSLRGTLQDVTAQRRLMAELLERRLAEDRIRVSEERCRWTFEQAAVGILHTAFDGKFLRCNERFARITGYSVSELEGLNFRDISVSDELAASLQAVEPLLKGEAQTVSWEKRYIRKDSSHVWVKLTCSIQRDEAGRPQYFISFVEDINDRKLAEQSLHLAHQVYETSTEGIVVTTADGTIVSVNPAFTKICGYALNEVIGRNMRILNSGMQGTDFYQGMWAALNTQGQWRGELFNRRKNGEIFPESLAISTVYNDDGTPYRRVGLFADISEAWANRKALTEANADLARQAKELAAINSELEQFAYVASHDLRQPLRTVASYLQLIESAIGKDIGPEVKEYFTFAINGAKRMDQLIIDLLDYSRIGRVTQPFERIPLSEVIEVAIDQLHAAIAEVGASIAVQPDMPVISGDYSELIRLFGNLISNALKYGKPGVPPKVDIRWYDGAGEWRVAIQDNGIGMPEESIDRAFRIFQRLVPHGAYEGSGIGLAICKKVVKQLGGRIWAESVEGKGSTFWVAFPKG